jgi:Fe2+ or Zn2+ uptake regulation protein
VSGRRPARDPILAVLEVLMQAEAAVSAGQVVEVVGWQYGAAVYQTLRRLEGWGWVEAVWRDGPIRSYQLTAAGVVHAGATLAGQQPGAP